MRGLSIRTSVSKETIYTSKRDLLLYKEVDTLSHTNTRTSAHAHAHTHEHARKDAKNSTLKIPHTQTETQRETHTHRWLTNGSSISAVRAAPRLLSDSERFNPLATLPTYAHVPTGGGWRLSSAYRRWKKTFRESRSKQRSSVHGQGICP